jgi:hypothetical protein
MHPPGLLVTQTQTKRLATRYYFIKEVRTPSKYPLNTIFLHPVCPLSTPVYPHSTPCLPSFYTLSYPLSTPCLPSFYTLSTLFLHPSCTFFTHFLLHSPHTLVTTFCTHPHKVLTSSLLLVYTVLCFRTNMLKTLVLATKGGCMI